MKRRICIVTPGHLASNPRVVKEADALHEAGYDVTVVAADIASLVRHFDEEIIATVAWRAVRVKRTTLARRIEHRVEAIAAQSVPVSALPLRFAILAHDEQCRALRRAAGKVPAHLYIGHYVAGLSAAAYAARHNGALLGYDAEDFHAGETADVRSLPLRLSRIIEQTLLHRCSHFTASAPLIGQAYEETYGIRPETILNVFPMTMMSSKICSTSQTPPGHLKAYWFSQSIGLDRGIQAFIEAMSKARGHVSLDIRGIDQGGRADALMALAEKHGVAARTSILPAASPARMVELAANYDVGLSTEPGFSENNRRALGNKIFTYLLAGTPVLMSDTPAQRLLAPDLGEAAALVSLQDTDGIACQLDKWAFSVEHRQRARAAARERVRTRYNWDLEKQILLKSVAGAFARGSRAAQ